jgi:hypothetical protein
LPCDHDEPKRKPTTWTTDVRATSSLTTSGTDLGIAELPAQVDTLAIRVL